jgi:hypothetical protein
MERSKRVPISAKDVIESFSEEQILLTIEQAEMVLEFLRGMAKVVVNDYLKESSRPSSDNTYSNNN